MNPILFSFRKATGIATAVVLAAAGLLTSCNVMMFTGAPKDFYLKNECSFPIVVAITYASGMRNEVPLKAGEKQGVYLEPGDSADSFGVMKDGALLYTFSVRHDFGVLIYNFTPTGAAFQASGS